MDERSIDIVIPWVDGSDPDWRRRKAAALGSGLEDDRAERYRSWDLLRFWFRGIEQFAPWVRKVWFICDQEPPAWLNTDCEILSVLRHEDYIPKEYLPTFSSHTIELNLHRIEGLSDRFVYFNDDTFLLLPLKETFFFRKGLPLDAALLNPIPNLDLRGKKGRIFTIPLNNSEYLNRDYSFRSCVRAHPFKWLTPLYGKSFIRNLMLMAWPRFVGFDELHLPQAFLKRTFEEAWIQDGDILDATCRHMVRSDLDVNQWLIRERQLAEGKFIACSPKRGSVFRLDLDADLAVKTIRMQEVPMVCLNDGELTQKRFLQIREELTNAFSVILPEVSCFEREAKS